MHTLTSKKAYELRVDLQRFNGDRAYAKYSTFSVAGEAAKYELNVKGYMGNAGTHVTYLVFKMSISFLIKQGEGKAKNK
jgi:ficolin